MMTRLHALALACITIVLWSLVLPATAAETTAIVVGSVQTPAGAPIDHASVTARSPSGVYTTRSDARGRFTFAAVPPDTYSVVAAKAGFAAQQQSGITLTPGATARVTLTLQPVLHEIGRVEATRSRSFSVGAPQDSFTVSGSQARGPVAAASSGLATYTRGSVQSAVAAIPGVQQDPFANVVIRGGKVDDVVFSYDGVPLPQAIVADPGGNVVGAQLPTTGLGFTTLTTGGFAAGTDDALGGLVDEIPQAGVFPAKTTFSMGLGLFAAARDVEFEHRWSTPSLHQRYAVDAQIGSQSILYGNGGTFYPSEAATYGLALSSRATWSVAGNVHLRSGARDDIEGLALAGEATYDQYGTPFGGETYGAFDGSSMTFPGEPAPTASVTTPTRVRGTYAIEKVQLLRTYDHSYGRLRLYRSQFGSATNAPFFDDLSFPNGAISFFGSQSAVLDGFGIDGKNLAAERHQFAYGLERRREQSALAQLVPTFDQTLSSHPVLISTLAYFADDWSPSAAVTLQGALRANTTSVIRSDGRRYHLASLDPHVSFVTRVGANAIRFAYDHTTVAPKPLQVERFDSAGAGAPFVPLAPERGDSYEFSFERGGPRGHLRLTFFSKSERDRIDVLPVDFRNANASGAAAIGVPQNVGALLANGAELGFARGPLTLAATAVHARSSSASQFGLNNLNAPAIAANHLFPAGYVPAVSVTASYRRNVHGLTIVPTLSYETGYPYGNGRKVWTLGPDGTPVDVLNDNHVNPGYNYYFLRDPSRAFDPRTNPIIRSLGTLEGDDPNTLRSTPLLLASLHLERPLSSRVTLSLDIANLFGTSTPTQLQSNPYLIGPPGYTGGNAAYAAWYGQKLNGQPYTLGNGVPTNDGQHAMVPWRYGTDAYVPSSYGEARSFSLRLRVQM